MKTPKTPIEFDYDLWTTEDGKCMVRVKITGEVTEVDRKVMRILRAEEKRLRRSKQGVPISGTEGKTAEERASVLSLSYVSYEGCEDLEPYWLIDSSSMEESVMFWMSEKEFRATLTPRQLDIYLNCIIGGQSKIDYPDVMSIEQMCEILSISTKTGYRILREGKICCLKVGRAYRIPKAHLFTFLCIGCGEAVTA